MLHEKHFTCRHIFSFESEKSVQKAKQILAFRDLKNLTGTKSGEFRKLKVS